MVKRSTWILIVLMAILASVAYYMQQPDNLVKKALASKDTPTAEAPGTLIPAEEGPLKGVSVQSASGQTVSIQQNNTGWMLFIGTEGPIPANQSSAEQVATQTIGVSLVTAIATMPSDLSVFGLVKPAYILKLTLNDDKSVTFKIGSTTLIGNGYYVQKEDGSIVVVDKYGMDVALNLLNQPPYMFTPVPATETSTPSAESTATPELTPTSTKQP